MSRPRASLRARMAVWFGAALALLLLIFAGAVYGFAYRNLHAQLARQLERDLAAVAEITAVSEDQLQELTELEEQGVLTLLRVDREGQALFRTGNWTRLNLDRMFDLSAPRRGNMTIANRPYIFAVEHWTQEGKSYRVATAIDADPIERALSQLLQIMLAGLCVATVLAVAGGYWLAGRLLRPVAVLAQKAGQISAERLSERLPIENPDDELGRMARAFNESLARLEDSFDRLKRFTADASHELRTPLTIMRSVGEVALRDARDPSDHREAIGSMLEEVDRLTRLIESLLFFARADADAARLQPEPLEVEQLAGEVVEHMRPLAEEKAQRIVLDCAGRSCVRADRVSLRQALINLLDNAIKYSPAGTGIHVSVQAGAGELISITIADQGIGISGDEHERIFERFYRVDPARTRAAGVAGGVGLGLAIARRAVEANLGRIVLESALGKGSTFRILLPQARNAAAN